MRKVPSSKISLRDYAKGNKKEDDPGKFGYTGRMKMLNLSDDEVAKKLEEGGEEHADNS